MVNINEAFPSNYIKAIDLSGQVVRVRIASAGYEEIGSDRKLILHFENKEKGLVLNKTNGMAIASAFGPETDGWIGADIELFSMKVPFNGQQVDAIRVRIPPPAAKPAQTAPNARDRTQQAAAPVQPGAPTPPLTAYDNDALDDEIPF